MMQMPSLEVLPNAVVGSPESLLFQVGANVSHGVLSTLRGLWFAKGATLMLQLRIICQMWHSS